MRGLGGDGQGLRGRVWAAAVPGWRSRKVPGSAVQGSGVGLSNHHRERNKLHRWSSIPLSSFPAPTLWQGFPGKRAVQLAGHTSPPEMGGEEGYQLCAEVKDEHLAGAATCYSNLRHDVLRFSWSKCTAFWCGWSQWAFSWACIRVLAVVNWGRAPARNTVEWFSSSQFLFFFRYAPLMTCMHSSVLWKWLEFFQSAASYRLKGKKVTIVNYIHLSFANLQTQ